MHHFTLLIQSPTILRYSGTQKQWLCSLSKIILVSTDGYNKEVIPYESNKLMIWENEVIDHNFKMLNGIDDFQDSDVWDFFGKITGNRWSLAGLLSGIGYIIHTYKDPSVTKAFILNDKSSNGFQSNGGTGKSLIMKMIGKIRSSLIMDGKKINSDSQFMFSSYEPHHRVISIDDLPKGFKLESTFNMITGGLEAEQKFKNKIQVDFKDSPKIMLSTNRKLNILDSSSMRRTHSVDLTDYFGYGHTPLDEYSKRFLESEWTWKDYNDFYNIMVYSCEFYLRNGLVTQDIDNQKGETFQQTRGGSVTRFIRQLIDARSPFSPNKLVVEGVAKSTESAYRMLKEYGTVHGLAYQMDQNGDGVFIPDDKFKPSKKEDDIMKSVKW